MEAWNLQLFDLLNAPTTASRAAITFANIASIWTPYLSIVLVGALWVWGGFKHRGAVLIASVSLLIGTIVNSVIHAFWHHPRPAELGIGNISMSHALDASFPSDHVTFIWSLGFGLLVAGGWRPMALAIIGLGLLTGWARVYVGVHFPFDILGAAGVSAVAAMIGLLLRPAILRHFQQPIEQAYEVALKFSHLPAAISPRKTDQTAQLDRPQR